MTVADTDRTWSDADLASAVRDHFRVEVVATGHLAGRGRVHVTDRGIMIGVGHRSVFNRATALDLEQFDLTMSEVSAFFGSVDHTLWIEAIIETDDTPALMKQRGYLPLPMVHGMATTSLPDHTAHDDDGGHAVLLADPSLAASIAAVSMSGFGLGTDDRMLFEDLARAVLRHARPWDHGAIYGVYGPEDDLVAVGSLLCTPDAAGITGLATLPDHRHAGHATAITLRGLHDAAALGYDLGVTMATPDSEPAMRALGFRPVIDYHVYRWIGP